jgi:hypothetical protein
MDICRRTYTVQGLDARAGEITMQIATTRLMRRIRVITFYIAYPAFNYRPGDHLVRHVLVQTSYTAGLHLTLGLEISCSDVFFVTFLFSSEQ